MFGLANLEGSEVLGSMFAADSMVGGLGVGNLVS